MPYSQIGLSPRQDDFVLVYVTGDFASLLQVIKRDTESEPYDRFVVPARQPM